MNVISNFYVDKMYIYSATFTEIFMQITFIFLGDIEENKKECFFLLKHSVVESLVSRQIVTYLEQHDLLPVYSRHIEGSIPLKLAS